MNFARDYNLPDFRFAAFTVAELDRVIAVGTGGAYACIDNPDGSMGYQLAPYIHMKELMIEDIGFTFQVIQNAGIMDENPANCRAKMLVYLLERNLVNLS